MGIHKELWGSPLLNEKFICNDLFHYLIDLNFILEAFLISDKYLRS